MEFINVTVTIVSKTEIKPTWKLHYKTEELDIYEEQKFFSTTRYYGIPNTDRRNPI